MALTVRADGTGAANQVFAIWWNDYYNLLTGAMNDQEVTLDYRPGAVTTGNATLRLRGDGNNPLLLGEDTDGTTITATLDHAGNLTISGNLVATGMVRSASVRGATGEGAAITDDSGNARVVVTPTNGPRGLKLQGKNASQVATTGLEIGSDGTVTIQTAVTFNQNLNMSHLVVNTRSLAGSAKDYFTMIAPDSNQYAFTIDTDGNWKLKNNANGLFLLSVTPTGGYTFPGTANWRGTLGGATQTILSMVPTDAGTKNWGLYYNVTDNSLSFYDATDNVIALRMFTSGNVTVAGALSAVSATLTGTGLTISGANQGIELGQSGAANSPYVDFHSGATGVDYDARLIATGGNGTSGNGTLNVQAGGLQFNGKQVFYAAAGVSGKFTAQTTAPTSPADGDLWLDMSIVL